ncbi:putative membrane protein [Pseudomonas sp. CCOS 191]|nr:putative membrane protein [Pseudomonas sp. CCOS 191]
MTMPSGWLIANALWLQVGWWACVLGAKVPSLLLLVPLGLAVHLKLCPARSAEVGALLRVTLAGCMLDGLLGATGMFRFEAWPLPLWLALLWLVLASGLRHSLAWAGRPFWRGAAVGALGGPLAYVGGARLADVALPLGPVVTGLLLVPVWVLALPLLVRLAVRR